MAGPGAQHEWAVAPYRQDRDAICEAAGRRPRYDIDAHRNRRGPYTAAGELVRCLSDVGFAANCGLSPAQQLTLLSVAPELRDKIQVSEEVENTFLFSIEGRTPTWTRRLAHGLTEFLLEWFARTAPSGCYVSFENVECADPVDLKFIAVLLRRADPLKLLVRVCTSSERVDEPLLTALKNRARIIRGKPLPASAAAEVPAAWRAWLPQKAEGWQAEWEALRELETYLNLEVMSPPATSLTDFIDDAVAHVPAPVRLQLARTYVDSDCTSDRLLPKRAYTHLAPAERKGLHRARAAYLEELGQQSLSLGAIPLHHEQAGGAVEPLLAASKYCMHMDYYDAARDWATRGRRMLEPQDRGKTFVELTRTLLFASLLLRRFADVETLCAETRADGDPALCTHTSYAMAILNARFYEPSRRDYAAAKTWVEKSLAFTAQRPPSVDRAVNTAFLRNTMALVEMRLGNLDLAEQILLEAIDFLATEAPDKYETEISLFLHNRARLHMAAGRIEQAIDELSELLRREPSNSEANSDRALLNRRLGRYEEALRDCDAAIEWSPPYPTPHLNRAAALTALGRPEEALAEYDYVLVLEPDHLGARTDRALLLHKQGRLEAARDDIEHGLNFSPANARLLCLRGLIELKQRDLDAAERSFGAATEADPSFADAWANRATIAFRRKDWDAALRDLTQALTLREDPATLYNRGRVLEACHRWREAAADHERALALTTRDAPHIRRHLDMCRQAVETEMLSETSSSSASVSLESSVQNCRTIAQGDQRTSARC